MELRQTAIPGCYEIQPKVFNDERGSFIKTFHDATFVELGLRTDWREEYYSRSKKGVIRGMHFQLPPMQHAKLVYCLEGAVKDVILDLRVGSPAYGQCAVIELSAQAGNMVYIPEGMAHGFCAMTEDAVMQYKVTSVHSPAQDAGILWSSIPANWSVENPIVSVRDQAFGKLANFVSPFVFDQAQVSS